MLVHASGQRPRTLIDKVLDQHIVREEDDGTLLLYVDRHLVHEVTSPQAFEGLRATGRSVRRPDCTLATADHNVPTDSDRSVASLITEADSRTQVLALEQNVADFGLTYYGLSDGRQGIVHVIGPEQGFTLPGTTLVCGDSHTSTHGAFGALAFGIGTSEVEHVLASQTLVMSRPNRMRIVISGSLPHSVSSKDVILHIISAIGTAGATGHVIEYAGSAIRELSVEARMSLCNMSIEAGARAGMVAPDQKSIAYLRGRPMAPTGDDLEQAERYWLSLGSDEDAEFDSEVHIDAQDIAPTVTWGTSPQDAVPITGSVPSPSDAGSKDRQKTMERALDYMGLNANMRMQDVTLDKVFIGSCTNSRIEDLRQAASIAKCRRVASHLSAMVVPGSGLVKLQAEEEGLDVVFKEAGFEWREPGCSMCLAMNPDKLEPGERCASTSNRNFEGRQGFGGRTHLMSPASAAASAIAGKLADVRDFEADTRLMEGISDSVNLAIRSAAEQSEPMTPRALSSSSGSASEAAGRPKFEKLRGVAAPIDMQNVDTDMIIPKQFLKTIKRSGLGVNLFNDLRYNEDGEENPDFILNQEPFRNAKVLVAGDNFGCGSSREHAPWSLLDFGIWCIISTSFADIFHNNCFKNGMLPVTLSRVHVDTLMADAKNGCEVEVDLPNQRVVSDGNAGVINFEIDGFRKRCLLEGLDDIGLTLEKDEAISMFERKRAERAPWLDGATAPSPFAEQETVPV
jgi:3-isopropylmalate dehydratase